MPRTVTVGLDGSAESRAAAEWAAREARLRGLPVKILHVWEPVPDPMAEAPLLGDETHQYWTQRIPRESVEWLTQRYPGVEVIADQATGNPAEALTEAADAAELMVLGSRGFGGISGFMLGSVSHSVIAHAERPVVLVRAGEQAADEHVADSAGVPSTTTSFRPVVLGLDVAVPDDTLLEFAFNAATHRGAALRVVHGWPPPPVFAYGMYAGFDAGGSSARREAAVLTEVLRPWRQKFPDVEVIEASRSGSPAQVLVAASEDASLVVVGRRIRTSPLGAHIGHVAHAVLHHVTAPVAVVAHD
ncbi:universal stress protein [Streptomyces pluripotens]|uniref:Universal stress protein n=1 Tax=Streptomyces pluripotens TaxID=1355015 RepID=A0A221P7P2_9ACTN|nr:stress-inducible protein [Streptomyces pluripotens]ASN28116.1 universal stress protein [Streptomyces pluripotens]KIE26759.1 stress-inducible protein [Streptomyces sp. MUSC 125]MCH0559294.1 universal stress protein [Streptomyces sp. MUM 16J]